MSKVWFITGTSRGFGRQWAIAALERGDQVIATARNRDSLVDLVEKYGDRSPQDIPRHFECLLRDVHHAYRRGTAPDRVHDDVEQIAVTTGRRHHGARARPQSRTQGDILFARSRAADGLDGDSFGAHIQQSHGFDLGASSACDSRAVETDVSKTRIVTGDLCTEIKIHRAHLPHTQGLEPGGMYGLILGAAGTDNNPKDDPGQGDSSDKAQNRSGHWEPLQTCGHTLGAAEQLMPDFRKSHTVNQTAGTIRSHRHFHSL
ncbi:hypothetical protein [Streptomyces sp. AK02-01A]|uniref:hypothetical protein n=1 Tax=Streptomyces sp. AK02-01A TaxID=3028648 RepID=UPI0029AF2587|nr:hypothetical protein [Streptomyces sp. AK02-01A]MDX3849260.1 hypothetical protein [Streptomyces sp. AK02-01A]